MVDRPNDMLVKADRLAHQARQAVLQEYVTDAVGRRILARAMNSPTMRPLLELELNGCTSYRSARLLLSEELVARRTFKARAQGFRGRECEYIELTTLGMAALFEEQEGLEDNRWLALLRGSIVGYCCVDDGQGICPTRSFLETALELPDPDILERVVHPISGERQFPEAAALRKRIDPNQRAKMSHWWSAAEGGARSGLIVDLDET